jgi:hypothetical protein
MEVLNSPKKLLDHGGITGSEGDIGVCMHGLDMTQVHFDGGWFDMPCEGIDPRHNGRL